MLKNYLQITFRSLYRNKLTSLINTAGLGLAIACCIPFYHIIQYETSFDDFHKRADRIYLVILDWYGRDDDGHVHYPAADALQTDFPDFEQITRSHGPVSGKISIEHPDGMWQLFTEDQIRYADPHFLTTFDFKSITPITSSTLQKPNEVLLTASLARKYFSDLEVIGKTIRLDDDTELQVVGLLEDPPLNTSMPFRMIVSYSTFDRKNKERDGWLFAGDISVYVTLREGDRPEQFRERLETFTEKHVAFYKEGMYSYNLEPLNKIHANPDFGFDTNYYAPPELIWLPGFLGILIIVIACINFVNLSTAQAVMLAKETYIRKVAGSSNAQLLIRFLLQTFVIVLTALLVGLLIGYILLNQVNQLFAVVNYNLTIDSNTLLLLAFLGLFILLAAGLYPALILIHLNPASIFRGNFYSARSNLPADLRKLLIVFQISSSLILLVAAVVVTMQINFWRDTDLKFRTNDILTFPIPADKSLKKESLRNALQNTSGIQNVSFSSFSPLQGYSGGASLSGKADNMDVRINFIDETFQDVYALTLIAGTPMQDTHQPTLLINEELAHILGFPQAQDALGNTIDFTVLLGDSFKASVSGVSRDFVNGNPMDAKTLPYAMAFQPEKASQANVALIPNPPRDIIDRIKAAFDQAYPNEIFSPELMTTKLEKSYELESLIQKAVSFISGLSILISCIGTIGIINFMAARRRKEFGVRKVAGADNSDIVKIFLKEFIIFTLIGFSIGGPIVAWLLQHWLQNYPHHLTLHAGYFLVALLALTVITVITILGQVHRVSNVNPAEILRTE